MLAELVEPESSLLATDTNDQYPFWREPIEGHQEPVPGLKVLKT